VACGTISKLSQSKEYDMTTSDAMQGMQSASGNKLGFKTLKLFELSLIE
jgi:hypothetical protein